MKKLYLTLLLFFLAMTVFIIPASADDFDNANFTGVNFNWHSGGPAVAPSQSAGSHYLIIYLSTSTWSTGDTEYINYYSLSDDFTSIRLVISNGGCTNIQTLPQNASGNCFRRYVGYRYSSSDSYTISNDSESSVPRVYLNYNDYLSKSLCVFTDLPCYDQNGNLITPASSPLLNFSMSYFMDGSGVYHYYVGTPDTIAGNNSYSVDWFVFDGSYSFPVTVENDTLVKQTLTETYCNDYLRKFTQFYSLWEKTVLGYTGLDNIINPATSYYLVPEKRISYHTRVIDNSFNPSNIGSIYRYVNSDVLTTHNTVSEYDFNAQTFLKTRGGSDFSNSSDISICVVIHDNNNNQYILLVHKFNVSDALNAIKSVNNANNDSRIESPEPTNISDWQSLAEYLKYLNDNLSINYFINNDNLVSNITSFDWANVVGTSVANGMLDFLPSLSGEIDTIFSGLFDDFYVPDLSDIEAQVDADEQAFSDKFQWVKDIKDEISFIITTPLQDNYGEFTFTTDFDKWGVGEITIFDSEWISSDVRGTMKIVITTFCTIALLFYIFKTLPSTLGNMPSD